MLGRDEFLLIPFSSRALDKLLQRWPQLEFSTGDSVFSTLLVPSPLVSSVDELIADVSLTLERENFSATVPLLQELAHEKTACVSRSDVRDFLHVRVCHLFLRLPPSLYQKLSEIFRDRGIFSGLYDLCLNDPWSGFVALHFFRFFLSKFPIRSARASFEQISVLRESLGVLDCILPPFVKSGEKGTEWESFFDLCRDKKRDAHSSFSVFMQRTEERSPVSYCLRLTNADPLFAQFFQRAEAMKCLRFPCDQLTKEHSRSVCETIIARYGNCGLLVLSHVFSLIMDDRQTEAGFAKNESLPLVPLLLSLISERTTVFVHKTAEVVNQKMKQVLPDLPQQLFSGGLGADVMADREADLVAASLLLSSSSEDVFSFLLQYDQAEVGYRSFIRLWGQKLIASSVWTPVVNELSLLDALFHVRVNYPLVIRVGSAWLLLLASKKAQPRSKSRLGKKVAKQAQSQSLGFSYHLYDFRHGASYCCDTEEHLVSCVTALLNLQIWRSADDTETLNHLLTRGRSLQVVVRDFTVTRVFHRDCSRLHFVVEREGWPQKKFSSFLSLRRWLRLECGIARDGSLLSEALTPSQSQGDLPLWVAQVNPCSLPSVRQFLLTAQSQTVFDVQTMLLWEASDGYSPVSPLPGEKQTVLPASVSSFSRLSAAFLDRSGKVSEWKVDFRFSSWGALIALAFHSCVSYHWHNALELFRLSFSYGVSVSFLKELMSLMPSFCGFSDECFWKQSSHRRSLVMALTQLYWVPLPAQELREWQAFLLEGNWLD